VPAQNLSRATLNTPHTNAYRLFHRAADGNAKLAVDRFNDVLVAHLYDGLTETQARPTLQTLMKQTQARAVYVKHRPQQASNLSESERAALAPATPFLGEAVEETVALENGLRFLIRPAAGLSVGLFLDMRDGRAWVRENAPGKTVLNCFAYTCGLGLAATAGGAARAVNLDVSRQYLEWGKQNYAINGFTPEPKDFITGDVFDWLKRFGKREQKFDVVILDPPPYSTTKHSRFSVQKNYTELAEGALKIVAPGGWLLACANAAELPLSTFQRQLKEAATEYPAKLIRTMHEPEPDFPATEGQAPYLKICFMLKNP
jgi:23S rRNA (cytosine1962-C5)-methyltransferase